MLQLLLFPWLSNALYNQSDLGGTGIEDTKYLMSIHWRIGRLKQLQTLAPRLTIWPSSTVFLFFRKEIDQTLERRISQVVRMLEFTLPRTSFEPLGGLSHLSGSVSPVFNRSWIIPLQLNASFPLKIEEIGKKERKLGGIWRRAGKHPVESTLLA